jgi:hypothetical protein
MERNSYYTTSSCSICAGEPKEDVDKLSSIKHVLDKIVVIVSSNTGILRANCMTYMIQRACPYSDYFTLTLLTRLAAF